jgi:hypothetical protein
MTDRVRLRLDAMDASRAVQLRGLIRPVIRRVISHFKRIEEQYSRL